MRIKCWNFQRRSPKCKKCQCKRIDPYKYFQTLIDYDNEIIKAGAYYLGKVWSLTNEHITRIRVATQRHIDIFKAGVPVCQTDEFTEGRKRREILFPCEDWEKYKKKVS